jgi:subtilisin family serine protease
VQGKVVVCDRGIIGRTEKSRNVGEAGGAGMILANLTPIGLNVDLHFVPSIHVDVADGNAIKAYVAANPSATAAITTPADFVLGPGRQVVPFSSRGPFAGGGDVLKPDLVGPGVDILAATSPAILGRDWDLMSGTSMSSPHVAGLAALLHQLHRDWSPMEIRSALMTTATTTTKNTAEPLTGTAFDFGAGFVVPNSAADPGLVYDSNELDWIRYACGLRVSAIGSRCAQTGVIDGSDVNQASIAVDGLAGQQTVTRTATNVSATAATYTVAVTAPPGIGVVVTPPTLTLDPGASGRYTVTLTNVGAALGQYGFGALIWSDGTHAVRSPLVVRPVAPPSG